MVREALPPRRRATAGCSAPSCRGDARRPQRPPHQPRRLVAVAARAARAVAPGARRVSGLSSTPRDLRVGRRGRLRGRQPDRARGRDLGDRVRPRPRLDGRRRVRQTQRGGAGWRRTSVPGLSFLGLPWMRTRGSALLGWVGEDAEHLARVVAAWAAACVPALVVVDVQRGSTTRPGAPQQPGLRGQHRGADRRAGASAGWPLVFVRHDSPSPALRSRPASRATPSRPS